MSTPAPRVVNTVGAQTSPRLVQLIYTSFDDGSSAGGWRVKAETGEVTHAERQELISRIVTRFDVGDPLPKYPTAEQISTRPARLAYAPLSEDSAGYWHTVDAGVDGTGRAGNVFAHVLLDRDIGAPSALRPIQLWGSPKWLRPFGAPEVAAATLNAGEPPGPAADGFASVVAFLTSTTVDRQSVFRVLLDAVFAAMHGGPGVMLMTRDLDTGPRWIAAVSAFMSPGAARRFSWVTHDDASLAVSDLRGGTHLVVVADSAIGRAPGEQWAVVDEQEQPHIGAVGSTQHQTANGPVTVTAWSLLAEGVLEDEITATRILTRQDAVADEVGDRGLSPLWPLAVAVREDSGLRDYHAMADRVIADEQPAQLPITGQVVEIVANAVAATAPATAPEALDRLIRAKRRGIGVAVAARRLADTALSDQHWLARGPLADVPAVFAVDAGSISPSIDHAVRDVRAAHPDPTSVPALHGIMRVAELVSRLSIADEALEQAMAEVRTALAEGVAGLAGPPSPELCADQAIGVAMRECVIRPYVAELDAAALYRVDAFTWAWLFADPQPAPVIPANPHGYDRMLLAHYILTALDRPGAVVPADRERLTGDAAFLALDAELDDADCRRFIDKLARVGDMPPADLGQMFSQWPNRISPGCASIALYAKAVPADLVAILADRRLADDATGQDRDAIMAARLRMLRHARPWTEAQTAAALADARVALTERLKLDQLHDIVNDLVEVLGVAFVVAQIRGESWADAQGPAARALTIRLAHQTSAVIDLLVDLTKARIIDVGWFVGHDLMRSVENAPNPPRLITDRGNGAGLAAGVLTRLFEGGDYTGPTDVAGLRNCAWTFVRSSTAEEAEGFFSGYRSAAKEWLQSHIDNEGGTLFGRLRSSF